MSKKKKIKNRELTDDEQSLVDRYAEHLKTRSNPPAEKLKVDEETGSTSIDFETEHDKWLASALIWDAYGGDVGSLENAVHLLGQALNGSKPGSRLMSGDYWVTQQLIAAIEPKDAIESMLATQMVATHNSAMRLMNKAHCAELMDQFNSYTNQVNKLLRTFATQTEALKKHRQKASQTVRVERVYVNEGGQAIVGDIHHTGGGQPQETGEQPHAITNAPGTPMRSEDTKREAVPVAEDA